jgi:DNA polymerase III delta prime subunit
MSQIFSEQLSLDQPLAARIFQKSIDTNKLARAYLLVGQAIEDKWRLIFELTAYLNCEQIKLGANQSCLNRKSNLAVDKWCTNCRWIESDSHPQALMRLTGNNKSGKIAVEEARIFAEEVGKSSSYFRIMVIEEANQEILHRPAANTLLKTIEEPRSNVLMIFFTQVASDVLPTITSRCQTINMTSKQYEQCWSITSKNNFEKSFLAHPNSEQFKNLNPVLKKFTSQESAFSDAIKFVESIQSALKNDTEVESTLDYLMATDLLQIKNIVSKDKIRYAKELFLIGQIAKEQSKRYVSEKVLIETFVYAWHRLNKTGTNPLKIQR